MEDGRAGERWEEGEVMGLWSEGRMENGGPNDFHQRNYRIAGNFRGRKLS